MDNIEDIYQNPVYSPFLLHCQERKYTTMQDLARCGFEWLIVTSDITPTLLMRIKSLFSAYCKQHPDLLMNKNAPKPRSKPAVSAPAPDLEPKLRAYFESHADTLIRVVEVSKALGLKRAEVLRVLESASWSKAVDTATFFYLPGE